MNVRVGRMQESDATTGVLLGAFAQLSVANESRDDEQIEGNGETAANDRAVGDHRRTGC